jgi:3-deoxy-D-manno-octulosonic-acid transferase
MRFIYTIFIHIYSVAIRFASLFNPKAKLWVEGRRDIFKKISSELQLQKNSEPLISRPIWIHCASLGEFEQGRPLIEKIKSQSPQTKIVLTFFSPSGYEIRKNYKSADHVFYLPADTPFNAKAFIEIVDPQAAFFIKYEFWFNYLNELKKKKIPTYLVSGIFRDDHYFFKNYVSWFRKQLDCFTWFFVQDEHSKELLNSIGKKNVSIAGDTRFDRVSAVSKQIKELRIIELFKGGLPLFIGGSTWPADEKLISDQIRKTRQKSKGVTSAFKFIIAPHEIGEDHIQSIIQCFSDLVVLRFSNANEKNVTDADLLILDNIGMLSSVYQYGTIAFIGGGFGKGIHNILEPAAFGLPVIFGTNYTKFTEAKELIKAGGAFTVSDDEELNKTMLLLQDQEILKTASHISKYYVESRVGATDKVLERIRLE